MSLPTWPQGAAPMSVGVTVTASATPHQKGNYAQIVASTPRDICGFWLSPGVVGAAGVDTSMLMDIAVGGAGNEIDRVSNYPLGGNGRSTSGYSAMFLPLGIPEGSRIAARIQGAVISDTFSFIATWLYADRLLGFRGYQMGETLGIDLATSGPTTGDLTDNAWDEAIAATAVEYQALSLAICGPPGSTGWANSATTMVDLGIGSAGSEQVLTSAFCIPANTEQISYFTVPVNVNVPVGTRLAIRKNSIADLSGAIIGWR